MSVHGQISGRGRLKNKGKETKQETLSLASILKIVVLCRSIIVSYKDVTISKSPDTQ